MNNDSQDGGSDGEAVVRIQINQIDHVLQPPGPLDNSRLSKVPVLRIFGPSSLGKKCCLHVHQVYPYFFVDYTGSMKARDVRDYANRLQRSLNSSIAISLRRDIRTNKAHYIQAVLPVKGIHFYGFHSSYSPFLKVCVADPSLVSRAVSLLQEGSVLSTSFRIYESHLGYVLQFLSDFGLYGCGWIDLGHVLKRGPSEDEEASDVELKASPYHRQSRMALELDVHAYHILNRHKLTARNYYHELHIPAPPMSNEPLVLSVRELWDDERNRRIARGLPSQPDMPIDLSQSARRKGGEWVAEARWWDTIRQRIERERDSVNVDEESMPWSKYVMTTFESIEALWEDGYKVWRKPEGNGQDVSLEGGTNEDTDIDVDVAASQRFRTEDHTWDNERDSFGRQDPQRQNDDYEGYFSSDNEGIGGQNNDENPFRGDLSPRDELAYSNIPSGSRLRFMSRSPSPSVRRSRLLYHFEAPSTPGVALQSTNKAFASQSLHNVRIVSNKNAYVYAHSPPTPSELIDMLNVYDLPTKVYQAPFYSKARDVPRRNREYGGFMFRLKGGTGLKNLDTWQSELLPATLRDSCLHPDSVDIHGWEYASHPPSVRSVKAWLVSGEGSKQPARMAPSYRSQIEGPTQANVYNSKATQPPGTREGTRERHDMSVLCLEVFAASRQEKLPDPDEDGIIAVFYSFQASEDLPRQEGIIAIQSEFLDPLRIRDFKAERVRDELELMNDIIDIVVDLDPDILVGWDVQTTSWSYLAARGDEHGLNVADLISRANTESPKTGSLQWETRKTSTFKVVGRHVLNVWRVMRSELNLNIYSFENVVFNVLRIRTPRYSAATLMEWYHSETPARFGILFRYFTTRTSMVLDILNASEVITKTAEFARVFGVDFFSVISRGSQFKVESFMFRIAKPESFVLPSPSKSDVGKQNAAECIPLIMEPQSAFYTSPVVVLDFQSLYPSIMIAYNYCYSTCLGRVSDFQGKNKFGITDLDVPAGLLEKLKDHIQVAPNGIMYVKSDVRRGLLGRMLTELLDTRVMVKQAMKGVKDDKTLHRILDARQLGLKYIANVTYGYTSASFSGRMPAVEIADSIVQSGRETLEKAITLVDSTHKWGAKVVYGDTDSMFIHLHGKTKEQAFRIGQDIADTITSLNPSPIKLKFEKVYMGCVLMAKKRYVGFKYENIDDEPVFDAKGIETVRRDGIAAQQKMVENCLKILFRTQDLSEVKAYCCRSWWKLLADKASLEDFIFAKEVRMGTYSDQGPPPPGAIIAARRTVQDPRDEPQWGERVPYVIARDAQGSRLVDKAMSPLEFLDKPNARLDADYYISRVLIPPLERIFNLVGANVRRWYDEMPKIKLIERPASPSKKKRKTPAYSIDQHFGNVRCILCSAHAPQGLCRKCREDEQKTFAALLTKTRVLEQRFGEATRICMSCAQVPSVNEIRCDSLDCSWMYGRRRAEASLDTLSTLKGFVDDLESDAFDK